MYDREIHLGGVFCLAETLSAVSLIPFVISLPGNNETGYAASAEPRKALNAHFYLCFCRVRREAQRLIMVSCRACRAERPRDVS